MQDSGVPASGEPPSSPVELSELVSRLYEVLRREARRQLSSRPLHTLQPTALLNEALLRFLSNRQRAELCIQHEKLLGPLLEHLRQVGAPMERFELGERLGRASTGEVFRAFDRVHRRDVTLQRVRGLGPDSSAPSPGIQIRFVQEAQVLAQLEHPGIPTVHEIGVDGSERLFFSMPLVRGESLEEHLERVPETTPPWTEPPIHEGLLQAARSIAHSHERGVIHRDLKPDNLMLGPYGAMQVVDWGIARVVDTERELEAFDGEDIDALVASDLSDAATSDPSYLTMAGGALGTSSSMPPE